MSINSAMWMAGGMFECSYTISASQTSGHDIEYYLKNTGCGGRTWDGNLTFRSDEAGWAARSKHWSSTLRGRPASPRRFGRGSL